MAKRRKPKKRKGATEPSMRVSFVNGQLQVVFREGINKDRRRVKKMKCSSNLSRLESGQRRLERTCSAGAASSCGRQRLAGARSLEYLPQTLAGLPLPKFKSRRELTSGKFYDFTHEVCPEREHLR